MYIGVKKNGTLNRVYQTLGVKGVTRAIFEKLGMWWRQRDPWGIGKLFGTSENTVNLEGCRFSVDNAAISSDLKEQLLLGRHEKPERTAIKQFLDPLLPIEVHETLLGKKPVDAMLAKLKQMGFTIAYRNWETYVFQNNQGDLRAAANG